MTTDPGPMTTDQTIGLAICLLMLICVPLAIWLGTCWNDTSKRLEQVLGTVKHPPTHAARDYQTCLIHGQRIPKGGDCAMCVEALYADLDLLERGETS